MSDYALTIDGVEKFDISTPENVERAKGYFTKHATEIPGKYRVEMATNIVEKLGAENASEDLLRYSHPVFRPEMQELIRNEARYVDGDFIKEAQDLAGRAPDMENAEVAVALERIQARRTNHVKIAHSMDAWEIAFPEAGKKQRQAMMDKIAFQKVASLGIKKLGRVLVRSAAEQIQSGDYQYYQSLAKNVRGKLESMV